MAHGQKVFLGGNIGTAYTKILSGTYDIAVIEVSSFQLETIQTFSPKLCLITNITSGHTERYKTHNDYIKAKLRIFMNMEPKGNIIFGDKDLLSFEKEALLCHVRADLDFEKSKLQGEHNKLNFSMATKVCESYLKEKFDIKKCQSIVSSFLGARFRCELIHKSNNVSIFNDGKSTSFEATQMALKAIGEEGALLILGGKLRTKDFDLNFLKKLKSEVYVFGEACEVFPECYKKFKNLNDLVEFVDIKDFSKILFSPAFPSFDLYENYEQRALHFDELIKAKLKSS
jgi:UDP-N-acetylmuramoylalanine--D-glutamate ligase